jgi:hypothetical protein
MLYILYALFQLVDIVASSFQFVFFENKPYFDHFSKFGYVSLSFVDMAPRLYTLQTNTVSDFPGPSQCCAV